MKDKSKKKKVLLLIVILMLCIIGFVIYKIFTKNKIMITIQDGEEITKIEATYDYYDKLVPKEKAGYKFNYYEINGQIFNPDKLILESIVIKTIYIKKDAITSKVKFVLDEFLDSKSINVEFVKGEKIVLPTIPSKKGYVLTNWKDTKGNIIHSDSIVTGDLEIVPNWEESAFIKSNGIYTCEDLNDECEIDGDNCNCEKRENALVKSYACKDGSIYSDEEQKCIDKTAISPTCKNGTYDESLDGCKITTNTVKTCPKGYLIYGKCYSGEYSDWTSDYSCTGYYFATLYEKCFTKETNPTMACPKGYTKESNSCYKIEKPNYCKTDYELSEENGNKECIQKSEKMPVFSCKEDYTLENYVCIKKYIAKASRQ